MNAVRLNNTMKQGWEIKKIRDICDKASSNIAQNKITELDGDFPVYGASGYVQNIDFFHRDSPYIGIVKDGAGVGRVNIYPAYSSLLGTLQYILPKDGYLLEYVAYALKSLDLASFASGATIPHIYFKNYGEIEIPVAPLTEQKKIVAELDCLSGIIEKKKQQLKEYDALAQSIFYEMFGNPIDNEKGWEYEKLSNKAEISSSKRIFANEYSDSGIPFYRGKEITEKSKGNPISVELFISQERFEEIKLKYGIPAIGDILVTAVGTIGNIWVVDSDEPFYFKDGNVLWLKIKDDTNPIYFKYILTILIDEYKEMMANGCAYSALTIANLKDMPTCITPLALQQEFASKIEAIEKQKELIKQSIAETETLFNSRMDYYFN